MRGEERDPFLSPVLFIRCDELNIDSIDLTMSFNHFITFNLFIYFKVRTTLSKTFVIALESSVNRAAGEVY